MDKPVHLIKLSVGTESVEGLEAWQEMRRAEMPDGLPRHITRMWPKREAEILKGGSIYWIIKGFAQCRQRILRMDEVIGADGIRRCGIVFDPELIRVQTTPRRAFQGWRYLSPDDAPADLKGNRAESDEALPDELNAALAEIGVL